MEVYGDAFIDISVICAKCGAELYSGGYYNGLIGKLKKKIHKAGWKHTNYGTLCPECLKEMQKESDLY